MTSATRSRRTALDLVVGGLATWRVTHLVVHEDGPGDVLTQARAALDGTGLGDLTGCFGCASVWVGGVVALATHGRPSAAAVRDGLALSGAAFLAQRVLTAVETRTWIPEPSEESPLVTVHSPD